jgi:lipoprotein-anchoring transpeptidase ErfK/SrfK
MKTFAMLLGAAACALATPAFAADGSAAPVASLAATAATLQPSDWVWQDDGARGPLNVIVSLADQRAYVYRGNTMIAVSSVSTGRDGKETPTGTFPILQKQVHHRSTLYDSARMPYMERLTWDGVAIHAGVTPGYRTSHGCIHVPLAFAKKLYGATDVGTVVEVTDAPVVVSTDPSDGDDANGAIYADAGRAAADANTGELQQISAD